MERIKKRNDWLTKKDLIFRQEQDPYFSHSVFLDAWEGTRAPVQEPQNAEWSQDWPLYTV
jgi:hypothetical protein